MCSIAVYLQRKHDLTWLDLFWWSEATDASLSDAPDLRTPDIHTWPKCKPGFLDRKRDDFNPVVTLWGYDIKCCVTSQVFLLIAQDFLRELRVSCIERNLNLCWNENYVINLSLPITVIQLLSMVLSHTFCLNLIGVVHSPANSTKHYLQKARL